MELGVIETRVPLVQVRASLNTTRLRRSWVGVVIKVLRPALRLVLHAAVGRLAPCDVTQLVDVKAPSTATHPAPAQREFDTMRVLLELCRVI